MSDQQDPQAALHQDLAPVRQEIDRLDGELLAILNQRAQCAQQVGRIKAAHGAEGQIYRPEREAQVLRRIQELNQGPLADESVTFFFREVMSACLSLERPLSVACLGPLGSFSESAAVKQFGHAAKLLPMGTFDEVFREVEADHADYGVVPVENSTGGAVGLVMDRLLATPLSICGEVVLRVHQNLLSRCTALDQIQVVYSHAQSLAQCHEWLDGHLPHAQRISVASNSLAAQMAAEKPGAAAIAGDGAADRYQLPRLATTIEDEPNNTTRFLVLSRHDAGVSGRDKTSLVMSAPNRTGSLHELLLPFSSAGVSLTRLESRPARHTLWEYVFFVDVEGHRNDAPVQQALQELAQRAAFLKVLGSYPVAVY